MFPATSDGLDALWLAPCLQTDAAPTQNANVTKHEHGTRNMVQAEAQQ